MNNNSKNISRAKKLFFDYLGSSFLMRHDGVEEEYHSLGISKTQELIWFKELKEELLSKLSNGDYSTISKLHQMSAYDALPKILAIMSEGDSWTKLRFAEDLWHFTEFEPSDSTQAEHIRRAREKAVEIWQVLLKTVTNPNVPEEVMKIAAKGRSAYDYFIDRLKSNLKKATDSIL